MPGSGMIGFIDLAQRSIKSVRVESFDFASIDFAALKANGTLKANGSLRQVGDGP
jgi:hypothetical protein